MVLVKETIEHCELLEYEENSIQATSIKVEGFPHAIIVTAVYCPPRHNLKKEHFETFFQTVAPKCIGGGDYNRKHTMWDLYVCTVHQ